MTPAVHNDTDNCVEIAGKSIGLTPESFVGILLGAIFGSLIVSNVMSILITWKLTKNKYCKPQTNMHYKAQINNPSVVDANGRPDKSQIIGKNSSEFPPPEGLVIENDNVFANNEEQGDSCANQHGDKYLVAMNDDENKGNSRFKQHRKSMDSVPDWELINSTLPRDILSSGKTRQPLDLVDGSNYVPGTGSVADPGQTTNTGDDEEFPPPPM